MPPATFQNIPTGCAKLDEILGGGFSPGELSLIYGEAETAKTTLAMQCAVNCAAMGFKTLFVDSDGTFSARRLSQIAMYHDFDKIAERIILAKPKDFREQAMVINRLADYLTKDFRLVVVDTLTSLYRAELAENPERTFEINRELNRQMAWLAQTARAGKLAVIVVSQVRSVLDEAIVSVEPVATRVLKFWADVILAMKPTENEEVIKVSIEKKGRATGFVSCYLRIEERGLVDYYPQKIEG
ncbi:MAG: AAA family ATPase [Candidatus Bathyarchaeota archaeon]|nr:AAA family ATPase [Candidatus Bathyarchaeota archaeon]